MMKRFLIYLCLGLVPALSSARNVIVKAELDSMMMWIGQQTGLHVCVESSIFSIFNSYHIWPYWGGLLQKYRLWI